MKRSGCIKTRRRITVAIWQYEQLAKQHPGFAPAQAKKRVADVKRPKNGALSTNWKNSLNH